MAKPKKKDEKMKGHSDTKIANKVIRELTDFEHQFKSKMTTLVISAFGLVAALMWNDAIREALTLLVPNQDLIFFKILGAAVITVIAVVVTVMLSKASSTGSSGAASMTPSKPS